MSDPDVDSTPNRDDADVGTGNADAEHAGTKSEADGAPAFETGRYLYCAVALSDEGNGDGDAGDAPDDFTQTGVDDEPVRLVTLDSPAIGIVVHDCASLYDTDRMDLLRKWLLEHQGVIDAAGERFGTPLPFRFDTIITGDDGQIREWAGDAAETLSQYLSSLAGFWEYRIELRAEESDLDAELEAEDPRLRELGEEINAASSGTSFLLEKQYEQRLSELRRTRRQERGAILEDRLADLAREVHHLGQQRATQLDDTEDRSNESGESSGSDGSNGSNEADGSDEPTERTQARLAVLAHEDREAAIGDALDEIAAEPGVSIRFTGPWPPYTFAPEIGAGGVEDR